jgi:hypothetical protein
MAAADNLHPHQFLWHVTTHAALPSIQKHGLNNERSTSELWANTDDWDSGAYMWDSPAKAINYSRGIREMGQRPVVLRVNPHGLDLSPDDTGASKVEGAHHAPHVPASNVEVPRRYR